jgi:hypothetical protein
LTWSNAATPSSVIIQETASKSFDTAFAWIPFYLGLVAVWNVTSGNKQNCSRIKYNPVEFVNAARALPLRNRTTVGEMAGLKMPAKDIGWRWYFIDKKLCRLGVDAVQKGLDGTPFRCDMDHPQHLVFLTL